jgi:hypothetical protein
LETKKITDGIVRPVRSSGQTKLHLLTISRTVRTTGSSVATVGREKPGSSVSVLNVNWWLISMLNISDWEEFVEMVEFTDQKVSANELTPRILTSHMNTLADFLESRGIASTNTNLIVCANLIGQTFKLCWQDDGPLDEDRKVLIRKILTEMKGLANDQIDIGLFNDLGKILMRTIRRKQGLCPWHGERLEDFPRFKTRSAICCGHERPYGDPVGLDWCLDPDDFDIEKRDLGWPNKPSLKARLLNRKERISRWMKRNFSWSM